MMNTKCHQSISAANFPSTTHPTDLLRSSTKLTLPEPLLPLVSKALGPDTTLFGKTIRGIKAWQKTSSYAQVVRSTPQSLVSYQLNFTSPPTIHSAWTNASLALQQEYFFVTFMLVRHTIAIPASAAHQGCSSLFQKWQTAITMVVRVEGSFGTKPQKACTESYSKSKYPQTTKTTLPMGHQLKWCFHPSTVAVLIAGLEQRIKGMDSFLVGHSTAQS